MLDGGVVFFYCKRRGWGRRATDGGNAHCDQRRGMHDLQSRFVSCNVPGTNTTRYHDDLVFLTHTDASRVGGVASARFGVVVWVLSTSSVAKFVCVFVRERRYLYLTYTLPARFFGLDVWNSEYSTLKFNN